VDDSHPNGLRFPNQTTQLLQPYCSWLSASGAEVSRKEVNELGAYIERDGAKIRLDQYLDQWLKTIKSQICGKHIRKLREFARKIHPPSLGKKPLVGIRPLDVRGVYQRMSDSGLSSRTVQGAHWVLNAAFRQALRWEMILEVPTKGLKLPRDPKA
jgi:hypothetical protein